MTSKMIEIDNVVAGYSAEVDILKGISLEVARSEIVTLLGPTAAASPRCSRPSPVSCCRAADR